MVKRLFKRSVNIPLRIANTKLKILAITILTGRFSSKVAIKGEREDKEGGFVLIKKEIIHNPKQSKIKKPPNGIVGTIIFLMEMLFFFIKGFNYQCI